MRKVVSLQIAIKDQSKMKIDIDCVMQDEEGGFVANCNQWRIPGAVVHQLSRTRRSSRLGTVHLTTSNSSAHRHYAYLTAPISGPTEISRVVWANIRRQETGGAHLIR
nr:hypothetical protein Iba_chr13eCG9060 [Ipomoea batatas]